MFIFGIKDSYLVQHHNKKYKMTHLKYDNEFVEIVISELKNSLKKLKKIK